MRFEIEIIGACNLRCPSCPVGNMGTEKNRAGIMSLGIFEKILHKIKAEWSWPRKAHSIALYSWGEPTLHPELPEFIRTVNRYGLPCYISTNLNTKRDLSEIMLAKPALIWISVSGFNQKRYQVTHRGGDIELVKRNMVELAELKRVHGLKTKLEVRFHVYRDNWSEALQMGSFCKDVGIDFSWAKANLLPLEKSLLYAEGKEAGPSRTSEDEALVWLLDYDLRKAFPRGKERIPCYVQNKQLSIDCFGRAQLCCSVYSSARFTLGYFLDMRLPDIQRAKKRDPFCAYCKQLGGHIYSVVRSKTIDGRDVR
jgi:MoaA/NifB/PqqE/SkfB family radical SAM enzyme